MTLTEGGEGGGGKGGSKWPDACLGKGGGVNNWTKRLRYPEGGGSLGVRQGRNVNLRGHFLPRVDFLTGLFPRAGTSG